MYAFIKVLTDEFTEPFDDRSFALDLLEQKHVLIAPGSSFNVPYRDHFRVTLLPDADQMREVMRRMNEVLHDYTRVYSSRG
jgi:alanine-synthesizing transaminase